MTTGRSAEWPKWTARLPGELLADAPLAPCTTLGIGGPADWLYNARTPDDLALAVAVARAEQIPFVIIGDGSNLLISDSGIRGLVIRNLAARIERRGDNLCAESGTALADLVTRSRVEGLTGLEFAAGIYGTVGGALFGNAGAYGRSMGDILLWAEVMAPEGRKRVRPEAMGFAYRRSRCEAEKWLILSCEVALRRGDTVAIKTEIQRIVDMRAAKLPNGLPSAGSYFKNIEDPQAEYGKTAAGKLLEEAGVKGLRVGGAAVYAGHANVIVNTGGATAADVLRLAGMMKDRVEERFGIVLQPEVRFLGAARSE